jgi:hypothetical protein
MTEQFRAMESPQYVPYQQEMTLRDYFAGQALIALHTCAESGYAENRARRCYEIADAMMEQRKVK